MDTRLARSSVVLSFLLHFAAALLFLLIFYWSRAHKPRDLIWIDVNPKKEERQVVDSDAGQKVEKAPEDAFHGKENRVVERETVARSQWNVVQIGAPPKPQFSAEQELKQNTGPLSHLGVPLFKAKPEEQRKAEDRPEWVDFNEGQAGAPNQYVRGLEESDQTALSTKEYVFYSYFERVRQQLDRAWQPILKDRLIYLWKRGRTLAGEMDYVTKTLVTIDSRGKVVRVQVLRESGAQDLDDVAIKAFNEAGPFPNPPSGLIKEGQVEIRWDFILKT